MTPALGGITVSPCHHPRLGTNLIRRHRGGCDTSYPCPRGSSTPASLPSLYSSCCCRRPAEDIRPRLEWRSLLSPRSRSCGAVAGRAGCCWRPTSPTWSMRSSASISGLDSPRSWWRSTPLPNEEAGARPRLRRLPAPSPWSPRRPSSRFRWFAAGVRSRSCWPGRCSERRLRSAAVSGRESESCSPQAPRPRSVCGSRASCTTSSPIT